MEILGIDRFLNLPHIKIMVEGSSLEFNCAESCADINPSRAPPILVLDDFTYKCYLSGQFNCKYLVQAQLKWSFTDQQDHLDTSGQCSAAGWPVQPCIFLARSASGCYLDTQTLKNHPFRKSKKVCEKFLKMSFSSTFLNNFHLNIIPLALYVYIMLGKVNTCLWRNLSILLSPLKNWTIQNFTIANFVHQLSKLWLSTCSLRKYRQHRTMVRTKLCISGKQQKYTINVGVSVHHLQ